VMMASAWCAPRLRRVSMAPLIPLERADGAIHTLEIRRKPRLSADKPHEAESMRGRLEATIKAQYAGARTTDCSAGAPGDTLTAHWSYRNCYVRQNVL
jgi:hypothetical protein